LQLVAYRQQKLLGGIGFRTVADEEFEH
jgi:hypothetical protein